MASQEIASAQHRSRDAAKHLWESSDREYWDFCLSNYKDALQTREQSSATGHHGIGTRQGLLKMDNQLHENLSREYKKRGYLTKDDMRTVLQYKMARERFQPRTQEQAEQNSENDIRAASQEAMQIMNNRLSSQDIWQTYEKAVGRLMQLKGVGAAAASSMLCIIEPNMMFMSEELMSCMYDQPRYSLKHLIDAAKACQKKAAQLGSHSHSSGTWTTREIEWALYAAAHSAKCEEHPSSSGQMKQRFKSMGKTEHQLEKNPKRVQAGKKSAEARFGQSGDSGQKSKSTTTQHSGSGARKTKSVQQAVSKPKSANRRGKRVRID